MQASEEATGDRLVEGAAIIKAVRGVMASDEAVTMKPFWIAEAADHTTKETDGATN